jgi:hypothetical protein
VSPTNEAMGVWNNYDAGRVREDELQKVKARFVRHSDVLSDLERVFQPVHVHLKGAVARKIDLDAPVSRLS